MTARRDGWGCWLEEAEALLDTEDALVGPLTFSGYPIQLNELSRAKRAQAYALDMGWVLPTGDALLAVAYTPAERTDGALRLVPQIR